MSDRTALGYYVEPLSQHRALPAPPNGVVISRGLPDHMTALEREIAENITRHVLWCPLCESKSCERVEALLAAWKALGPDSARWTFVESRPLVDGST
jgi:hypothetical protein